jgi:2-polyprenyl-3-methyl-5-hydroxy-6-metoxy-1,4-benzoquinol methylase
MLRSTQPEILDLGPNSFTKEEYDQCLKILDKVGRWLGGDRATLHYFSKMSEKPSSVLDVGCGGGHFAIRLAKNYPETQVLGIDINPYAIEFAKSQLAAMQRPPSNVTFELKSAGELDEAEKCFDVVLACLMCHHFSDSELVSFIQQASLIARKKVIINDLQRSYFAWLAFKWISPILFSNRVAIHDGLLSIRKSFTRKEWKNYLMQAGIDPSRYTIKWHWAFRWVVEINCR